ncbi:hypothetical protein NESM_000638600 [Novymonas esmeraldas]|uniref:C3H1-type domain-containing protein n=1 Tax=Novymonas esmeraldas TaxID=1808958 RepID=A0AAW0ETW3_9TRYP
MPQSGTPLSLKSHFCSTGAVAGITTSGFAVSPTACGHGGSAAAAAATPAKPTERVPVTPHGSSINFLVNAASSYQTHFGDPVTGAVAISALPARSPPLSPEQQVITFSNRSSSSGGGGGSATYAPPRTSSSTVFAGSPASAPGSALVGATATTATGFPVSGSPQTPNSTPLMRFSSPSQRSGVPTDDLDVPLHDLCTTSSSSSSASSSTASLSAVLVSSRPVSVAHTNMPPQRGADGDSIDASSVNPLLSDAELNKRGSSSSNSGGGGGGSRVGGVASAAAPRETADDDDGDDEEDLFGAVQTFTAASLVGGSDAIVGAHARCTSPASPEALRFNSSAAAAPLLKSPDGSTSLLCQPPPPPPPPPPRQRTRAGASGNHAPYHATVTTHNTTVTTNTNTNTNTSAGGVGAVDGGSTGGDGGGASVGVYNFDFRTLLSIPAAHVLHRPHPSLGVSRLVLCRNFSVDHPGSCPKGALCKFVHADVRDATHATIHVNYAWRSLSHCTYARLPPGDVLTVLAPNERPPTEVIPSERILLTRGSAGWREHVGGLSHCAHYYFNRMCNRGERCNFIHAVHVDPNVQGDFKRAPAPTAVAPLARRSAPSTAAAAAASAAAAGGRHTNHDLVAADDGRRTSSFSKRRQGCATRAPLSAQQQPPPPPPPPPSPPPPMRGSTSNPDGAAAAGGGGVTYLFSSNGIVYAPVLHPAPPLMPAAMGMVQSPVSGMPYAMRAAATCGGGGVGGGVGGGGEPTGYGYIANTLPPPPPPPIPSQWSASNGVYFLLPSAPGSGVGGGGGGGGGGCFATTMSGSPVSPMGRSSSSGSNGPVDWSFYGELETRSWMPSSPSPRM